MKKASQIVLAVYLFFVLWLVLFKFSYDIFGVIATHQSRSLNVIPFVGDSLHDVINNVIYFIPLGLLLGINFKHRDFWKKVAFICGLSIGAEAIQYILAIGRTDITDVISNTLGGFIGLGLYEVIKKYIHNQKLDRLIVIITAILLMLFFYVRIFVSEVRY